MSVPSCSFKTIWVFLVKISKINNNGWIVQMLRKQQSQQMSHNCPIKVHCKKSTLKPSHLDSKHLYCCFNIPVENWNQEWLLFHNDTLNMLNQCWLRLDSCSAVELSSRNKMTSFYWACWKTIPEPSTPQLHHVFVCTPRGCDKAELIREPGSQLSMSHLRMFVSVWATTLEQQDCTAQ